ncbi:MAG: hypothetical protein AAGK14_14285, partial [Verrucomicrobiota bacterium]
LAGEVPVPVLGGYVATFIMPAVIGPVFDRGLEKMKVAVESAPDQPLLNEFQQMQDQANQEAETPPPPAPPEG